MPITGAFSTRPLNTWCAGCVSTALMNMSFEASCAAPRPHAWWSTAGSVSRSIPRATSRPASTSASMRSTVFSQRS